MTRDEQNQIDRVAGMEWDDFSRRLETVATRGPGAKPADDDAMRKYFGDAEYEELKRLAQRTSAARQRAPLLGNLVLLPGIMGSNLVTTDAGGDEDLIWVSLLRLVRGQVERLRLTADGARDAGPLPVRASRVDKRTYTRALLTLGARWNVQPFPFDWRRHIDTAADGLAQFIKEKFPGQPVHLVAHSMGGLVSRNFVRRHRKLWETMRGDAVGPAGGRLVMLGTPNYGSYAIPQAMTGVEKLIRWLEKVDLDHDLEEVLAILNSFVGSYLLLPAPGRIPAELRKLYEAATWGSFPVSQRHLDRARDFHQALEGEPATIDPTRMAYIAGCNQETLLTMEITSPGEFRYFNTLEGDGRVPFTLGLLKDVPTWYVEEAHGSLPKNERVLRAVDQILERGRTDALPASRVPPRAFFVERSVWHRALGDYLVESKLERIAQRARDEKADAEEIRFAEETLTRALAGETGPARKPGAVKKAARTKRRKLAVEVVWGDVTRVPAPVVAVGSYKGVTPVAAIGALDEALDFWISRAMQGGMLGAELGQVFFIPVQRGRHRVTADAVLVAGMGEEGRFDRHDLRYLALNVTYAVSALRTGGFATVLIGGGKGSLQLESAVQGLLFGVCDALGRLDEGGFERLTIVEWKKERAEEILQVLERVKAQDSAAGLEISIGHSTLPQAAKKKKEPPRPPELPPARVATRITVEREGDVFRFSALTQSAVVAVREVEAQSFYSEGVAESLKGAFGFQEQELYGRLLYHLLPQDFEEHYQEPLTVIVDRSTAGIPWEMVCFTRPEGRAYFGTHLGLTRQFRTLLSSRPGIAPPLDRKLRVLVVADPPREPELQLPGARQEGEEVVRILRRIRQQTQLEIEVVARIGWQECNPVEILALILDGNFDVVHFAGHGIFDPERPNRGGWVFGKAKDRPDELLTLSPREIFLARRVPRLVFANACFSAVVSPGRLSVEEMNRRLAGIAEAFFDRGVPNYLGAGWPVQDDLAVRFAAEFYAQALTGQPASAFPAGGEEGGGAVAAAGQPAALWSAVSSARKLIAHDGSTWGAYQHYGEADGMLVLPAAGPAAAKTAARRPRTKTAPRKRPRRPAARRRR